MSYRYEDMRPQLFTEVGQEMLLKVKDNVQRLCKEAGVVRAQEAWRGVEGDTWLMLACLDRLVELGYVIEVRTGGAAQHRIFVAVAP